MRHRKRGRTLGRSPSHRRAMLRNLASSLFLTERDSEYDENPPKVKGRVVTTLQKAKEVRPLVEKCITIARHSLEHEQQAAQYATNAERGSSEWKSWRNSAQWQEWNEAMAPAVAARRRALRLLGDKQAVDVLFTSIAPRFAERNGGYTRILRLASPRLGDGGTRAILELVGVHDRVRQRSEKPAFAEDEEIEEPAASQEADQPAEETPSQPSAEQTEAPEASDAAEQEEQKPQGDA